MRIHLLLLVCLASLWAHAGDAQMFAYNKDAALNLVEKSTEVSATATRRDITFAGSDGQPIRAYVVSPLTDGSFAGVLYVHWLGDPETTNRTQFLKEAEQLAPQGVVSLLLDMPWSAPGWFEKRKLEDDYEFSIRQVKDLRRALDVLLSQKGIDPKRVAYVGHDFGSMYGALLLGIDSRVHYAVLMAGTPVFSDWFLLGAKIAGAEREAYIKKMAPLDPTNYIGDAKSVPMLFQFSNHDEYIPKERAEGFMQAAKEPKEVLWYDAGHGLNAQAAADREKWLESKLGLGTGK